VFPYANVQTKSSESIATLDRRPRLTDHAGLSEPGRVDKAFWERDVKMWQLRVRNQIMATVSLLFALLISLEAANARGPGLPNVMVLATGGTIAGSGASSTTVVGYTAATVGIETLLNAVPELKTVATSRASRFSRSPART
jgi:L-asparaginase